MFAVLLLITIAAFAASAYLCATPRRVYVLAFFGVLSTVSPLIHGYYWTTNFLGFGKQWSFLDGMFICLLLIAWVTTPKPPYPSSRRSFFVPMAIIVALSVSSLALGSIRSDSLGVLNYSRRFLFAPIFFVAARILGDRDSVNKMLAVVKWFVIPFFALHVAIAFNMYRPPLDPSIVERVALGRVDFYRVDFVMSPLIYVVAVCITLCDILYRRPKTGLNWTILVISITGVLLTQTRAYYLALALAVLVAFVLLRGKGKLVVFGAASAGAVYLLVSMLGINVFYRFTTSKERVDLNYWDSWRGAEYRMIANTYAQDWPYILTGRGFGVLHEAPWTARGYVNFFHNGYLQVLNSLGLIGLKCYLILLGGCILANRGYARDPDVGYMLALPRLLFIAAVPVDLLFAFTWHPGAGPLLLCLMAVACNGEIIAERTYEELDACAYDCGYASADPQCEYATT